LWGAWASNRTRRGAGGRCDLLILRHPAYTSPWNVHAREATRMTIANGLAERIHLTAAMLPARRAAA